MKTIKGYQVVIEDNRSQYDEPGIYIRQVHTSYAEAEKEFNEAVEDAKTNTAGDFDWLASALETYPNNVKEKWHSGHWVEFKDIYADDKLNIYINEVDIAISECNEITDDARQWLDDFHKRDDEHEYLFSDGEMADDAERIFLNMIGEKQP